MRLLAMLIVAVAWFASPEAKAAGFSFIDSVPAYFTHQLVARHHTSTMRRQI